MESNFMAAPAIMFTLPARTKMTFANGGTNANDRQRAIILVNPQIPNGVQKAILGDGPDDPQVVIEPVNSERKVSLLPEHSTDGQGGNDFEPIPKYKFFSVANNNANIKQWEVRCEDGTDEDYDDFIITVLMEKVG